MNQSLESGDTLLPQVTGKFMRLAAIDLRFTKEKEYLAVINLYCDLLGLSPRPDPQHLLPSYAYPIGKDLQAMELRFMLKKGGGGSVKKNRTILYWDVAESDFDTINTEIVNLPNYTQVEPPTVDPLVTTGQTMRSIIEDPSGNLFGPITNPPYPLILKPTA
jgi:hypothetical protein